MRRKDLLADLSTILFASDMEHDVAMRAALEELRRACDLDVALAYSTRLDPEGHRLRFAHWVGPRPSGVRPDQAYATFMRARQGRWGLFDPTRPARSQQNRVFAIPGILDLLSGSAPPPGLPRRIRSDVEAKGELEASLIEHHRVLGVEWLRSMRALLCERGSLLAWLGGYGERIRPAGLRALAAAAPLFRRRLQLDNLLGSTWLQRAALDQIIEQVPAPAVILGPGLRIEAENQLARRLRILDRRRLDEETRSSCLGPGPFEVIAIRGRWETLHLLIRRGAPDGGGAAVPDAASRYRLTPRQAEVLGFVLDGWSNGCIAAQLGRSARTVELHITAIFEKTGASSRADLISRLLRP